MVKAIFRKSECGNILVLVCVFAAVNALAMIMSCSFGGLFFVHNRLQTSADEIALAGARKLNETDRLGQMNNMIGRCRQLVFSSRKTNDEALERYPQLRNLSQQLLAEARQSASDLEAERVRLASIAHDEALISMHNKFNEIKGSYPMSLPWLKVSEPVMRVSDIKFGKMNGAQSNVSELKGLDELAAHDASSLYIHSASHLYRESINARLPAGSDGSLDFKISSLPAPVEKTISPARVTLAKNFRQINSDHLPSAVQIELKLDVATGLGTPAGNQLVVTGTGAAVGGADQL